MITTPARLKADLYQLKSEEVNLEHVAGSGHLSSAMLYANHGKAAQETGFDSDSVASIPGGSETSRLAVAPIASSTNASDFPSLSSIATSSGNASIDAALGDALTGSAEFIRTTLPESPSALGMAALPGSANGLFSQNSPFAANGLNGSDGNSGVDGLNGTNGNDGNDGGSDGEACGCGPTIELPDITINLPGEPPIIIGDGEGTDVVDVNLGGDSIKYGSGNDLIDIDLLGNSTVSGNDNDGIDLNLGGNHYVGGNDNDLIDLDLLNNSSVEGNDNDIIDLGLLSHSTVGGNDNDLIDLDLLGNQQVSGSDNDLIDLNILNGETAESDNDFIDISLLSPDANNETSHSVIGLDVDLLDDGGLASVDLGLADQSLLNISLSNAGESGTASLTLDLSPLLTPVAGESCDDGSAGGDSLDIGFTLDLPDLGVLLGNDCPASADDTGQSGPLLGLQLGLGALV